MYYGHGETTQQNQKRGLILSASAVVMMSCHVFFVYPDAYISCCKCVQIMQKPFFIVVWILISDVVSFFEKKCNLRPQDLGYIRNVPRIYFASFFERKINKYTGWFLTVLCGATCNGTMLPRFFVYRYA